MVLTEIKRLRRIWFQPHLIADRSFKVSRTAELARFLWDFLRPHTRYYVWAFSDPYPFLADIRNLARKFLRQN
jgi:hypothetical protein